MFYKYKGEKGNILLSKSVFFKIITEIIERYDGNVLYSSTVNKNRLFNNILSHKKNEPASVDVSLDKENRILVDVSVMLRFGTSIKRTGEELTVAIKDEIEKNTGVEVSKVNISIDGMFARRKKILKSKD